MNDDLSARTEGAVSLVDVIEKRELQEKAASLARLMQEWFGAHGFLHRGFEIPIGATVETLGQAWLLWGEHSDGRPDDMQFVSYAPVRVRFILQR